MSALGYHLTVPVDAKRCCPHRQAHSLRHINPRPNHHQGHKTRAFFPLFFNTIFTGNSAIKQTDSDAFWAACSDDFVLKFTNHKAKENLCPVYEF
jgi:hypothetical protein